MRQDGHINVKIRIAFPDKTLLIGNTLYKEISALKDKVPPTQWKAIDALRALGNIGAHMEKDTDVIIDIDPEEARKLIGLIELLMDKWYISRYDEEQKYKDLIKTNEEKQALR